jgi:hypothetical protein
MKKWVIWACAGFGAFYIILGIHACLVKKSFSEAVYFSQGAYFLFWVLFAYLKPIFIYSEMDAACLRMRQFWKMQEFAWHEITSAGRFGFGTDKVIVRFGHQMEVYGNVIVQPADRNGFLAALRQYAPQAEIDT